MPDPMLFCRVMILSALAAGVGLLLLGWPWRGPRPVRLAWGLVLSVSGGFYLGCWALQIEWHWPPHEDQDRFLLILLPAVLAVELLASLPRIRWWIAGVLRLVIVVGAARVLLHNSSYLTDLDGSGSAVWSDTRAFWTLTILALLLGLVWSALGTLNWWRPSASIPLSLAVTCAGAGATVMLSGYLTGGQVGLPLGAAVAGASVVCLLVTKASLPIQAVSLGVVGLFSILVAGRYFGELTTSHALMLLLAPLLAWLPELPYIRRIKPWMRGTLRLILVAIPVLIAVAQARAKYVEDSKENDGYGQVRFWQPEQSRKPVLLRIAKY